MARIGATLALLVLLGAGACTGQTVVIEPDPPAPTATAPPTTAPTATPAPPAPTFPAAPEPGDLPNSPAPPAPPTLHPPAPAPAPSAPGPDREPGDAEESDTPAEPEGQEPDGSELDPPGDGPFTFPQWEEFIFDSRNSPGPELFTGRATFKSCGDHATQFGADLLSPHVAECLDQGRAGPGRESVIAVQLEEGSAHVWFVRVGPAGAEYFRDESHVGGEWLHATCNAAVSIGLLDCAEPRSLAPAPSSGGKDSPVPEDSAGSELPPATDDAGSANHSPTPSPRPGGAGVEE